MEFQKGKKAFRQFLFVQGTALALLILLEVINFLGPRPLLFVLIPTTFTLLLTFLLLKGFGVRWLLFFNYLVKSMLLFFVAGEHFGFADAMGDGKPGEMVGNFPGYFCFVMALFMVGNAVYLAAAPYPGYYLRKLREERKKQNDPMYKRRKP